MEPGAAYRGVSRLSPVAGVIVLVASGLAACTAPLPPPPVQAELPPPAPPEPPTTSVYPLPTATFTEVGLASWYGRRFHKKHTASGERYNMRELTAAHRSLPLDTMVRVTNLRNNRSVTVRINDRGPYAGGRIIDVSHNAAALLGMTKAGVVRVRVEVFQADQSKSVAENLRPY
jgi:rare lipoprotein A